MSLPRVYLETSFISYLAAALQWRNSSDVNTAHRQMVSALWWTKQREQFDLFISDVVERECAVGHSEAVQHRTKLLTAARVLPDNREIMELAKRLVEPSGPLPRKAEADATHIAFASVYECDYLLTWNFKHIANALLQPVLYKIIQSYGYQPSLLCTPEHCSPDTVISDEIMNELEEFREAYAAQFDYDIARMLADAREFGNRHRVATIPPVERKPTSE